MRTLSPCFLTLTPPTLRHNKIPQQVGTWLLDLFLSELISYPLSGMNTPSRTNPYPKDQIYLVTGGAGFIVSHN
jgi:hypothetical protein